MQQYNYYIMEKALKTSTELTEQITYVNRIYFKLLLILVMMQCLCAVAYI